MRITLPNRRPSETFDVVHNDQCFHVSVGTDARGSIAEIFISSEKPGSYIEAAARDAAILASLALQHGCPVDTMRHALTRDHDGSPATIVGAVIWALP